MSARNTTVNLDLSKQGCIPSLTISQYDVGVALNFLVMDGNAAFAGFESTDVIKLKGTRPSGTGFQIEASNYSSNWVSFHSTMELTAESGSTTCEIEITRSETEILHTANFYIEIEAAAHPDGTIDQDIEQFNQIAQRVGAYATTALIRAEDALAAKNAAQQSESKAEEYMNAAMAASKSAAASKDDIQEYIDDSEAWARGTRDGVDVPSTDETYHNNSKYYAERSSQDAEAWARGTRGGTAVPSTDETYENNAMYYANESFSASAAAGVSATEAAASAQQAAASVAGAVKYTAQTLTDAQKAQARTNIGAASPSDIPSGTVRYDTAQSLTDAQKTQAKNNIGVPSIDATLSITGAAADAKKVGDEISDLKGDLSEISDSIYGGESETTVPLSYDTVQGQYVNNTNGSFVSFNNWTRSDYIPVGNYDKVYFNNGDTGTVYNCLYNSNKSRISSFSIPVGATALEIDTSNAEYMAISQTTAKFGEIEAYVTGTAPTEGIVDEIEKTVKFTEQTLTESQKAQARNNIGVTSSNGLSEEAKTALLEIFRHVAYEGTNGQVYLTALQNALYDESGGDDEDLPSGYTRKTKITVIPSVMRNLPTQDWDSNAMDSSYKSYILLKNVSGLESLKHEFSFDVGNNIYQNGSPILGRRMYLNSTTPTLSYYYKNGSMAVDLGDKTLTYGNITNISSENNIVKYELNGTTATITVNGTPYTIENINIDLLSVDQGFAVLGNPQTTMRTNDQHYYGSSFNVGNMSLRYVKYMDSNDNVLNHFVPCEHNGIIGMYDIKENVFYTATDTKYATIGASTCCYSVS